MKILNTEQFIQRAREIHGNKYDYSKSKYEKSLLKLEVLCKKHGSFRVSPNNHLSKGSGCPKCSAEKVAAVLSYNIEIFIQRAREIHGNKYDYSKSKYVNTCTKLSIVCKKHGTFEKTPTHHLKGQGCPKCSGRNKTTKDFILEAREIHGNKYDYSKSKYLKSTIAVTITCRVHGDFEQSPRKHILYEQGCVECYHESRKSTQKEFIQRAKYVHGDTYKYNKVVYCNSRTKVVITCKVHGDFEQTPDVHLRNKGCKYCAVTGFDPNKRAYFYILEIIPNLVDLNPFIGYGISNSIKSRINRHRSNLKYAGFYIKKIHKFKCSGKDALDLENKVKSIKSKQYTTNIDGFKTEAVKYQFYGQLLESVSNFFSH